MTIGEVDANPRPEGRKTFQEELDEVRTDVIRLAALTTEAITAGTQAFLDGDLAWPTRSSADDVIDDLYHPIEIGTFLLLATQQPVAADLRAVLAILRINHELERSADLMVNVAKTTRRLYPHELDPKMRGIIDRMGVQASEPDPRRHRRVRRRRPVWAAALADMDDAMDELSKSLFRHILTPATRTDEGTVLQAVQMALVGRHYERIADHAVHDRGAGALHGDR